MEEQWYKLWTYNDRQSKLWIPGDTVYISNYGNVRLNDIKLTLGHGLWMNKEGNINIVGLSYGKYTTMYRFIYTMAVDNTFDGGHQWQIHHIDRNHSNNRYDNLIKVTGHEHLGIHKTDFMDAELMNRLNKLKEYYKSEYSKKDKYIEDFKEWQRNRYNEYYNNVLIPQRKKLAAEREQQRLIEKEQRLIEQEQQRLIEQEQRRLKEQELIDAGTHFRCKNGRLMSYQQIHNMHAKPRDNSYITDEYRKRLSKSLTDYFNNPDNKESSDKTRRKMSEARKGKSPSEETRNKLRESNKGKKRSDETRRNISINNGNKGKHWKVDKETGKRIYY